MTYFFYTTVSFGTKMKPYYVSKSLKYTSVKHVTFTRGQNHFLSLMALFRDGLPL